MSLQHTHKTSKFSAKKFPFVLVCDGVQSPSNIGALFRICDAFGVSEIIFCNTEININSPRLQKTARSTQKKVSFSESINILTSIEDLKKDNYTLIALEITNDSIPLEKLSLPIHQKVALIIGNEQEGISGKVLKEASQTVHIEMFGENSSMNVVQATTIALYTIVNKLYLY